MRKNWRYGAGGAGILVFTLILFGSSEAVHKCEVEGKQWRHEHGPHTRGEWWERVYRRIALNGRCAGSADDVWVALSGIAVAGFTFTLWRSTERLWKSAEDERKAAEETRRADYWARAQEVIRVERALNIAGEHAKAAETLVAQNADTARRQLRAYVHVVSVAIKGTEVNGKARAEIIIKNSGQTPAYNLKQWAIMGFGHYPLDMALPIDPNVKDAGVSTLGSAAFVSHFAKLDRPFIEAEIAALVAGHAAIYVRGKIAFTDVFGGIQTTEYLFFTGGPIGLLDRVAPYMTGNEST